MKGQIELLIEKESKSCTKNAPNTVSDFIGYGFKRGVSFALSLFRWRKVSEDHFSKVEKVLIKVMCYFPNGHKCIRYTTGVIFNQERHSLDDDFIEKIASHHEIIEWMPIPEGGNDE